jgi:hypothetical protein
VSLLVNGLSGLYLSFSSPSDILQPLPLISFLSLSSLSGATAEQIQAIKPDFITFAGITLTITLTLTQPLILTLAVTLTLTLPLPLTRH